MSATPASPPTVTSREPNQADVEPIASSSGSPVRRVLGRLWQPGRYSACVLLVLLAIAAIIGPMLVGDANRVEVRARLEPPIGFGGTWDHPLGTDGLGRDMLAQLLNGARSSLVVGIAGTLVAALIGIAIGLLAGFRGGFIDTVAGSVIDFQLAFPALLIVLLISAYVSSGLVPLTLTLAFVSWIVFAQMARSLARSMRDSDFVAAAKLAGTPTWRVLARHLLPNMWVPMMTLALLEVAHLMLAESGLSYLGLGVQPPDTSWGLMISEGQSYLRTAWWVVVLPGLAIVAAVLVFNQLSRSLRSDRTLFRRPRLGK